MIDGLNPEPPPSLVRTALIEARNGRQFEGGVMKFKQFLSGVGAIAALSATLAGPAKAGSVVSFDSITGNAVAGDFWPVGTDYSPFGNYSYSGGMEFTATATGYIDSLTLALSGNTADAVTVYSDNGSNQLGTALESLSLGAPVNSLATGSYTSGVMLQKGDNYWILGVTPSTLSYQYWTGYDLPEPHPLSVFEGLTECCVQDVTSGTYTAGSSVGFGLIVTIADGAKTAVPEPATWTMLIAGFGMIGAAVRRKPRAFASA